MSVQTRISLAWPQLRRQRRLKLGSLLNDHDIFKWLIPVYARRVRSSPTSIATELPPDLKVVNDLRKSWPFDWRRALLPETVSTYDRLLVSVTLEKREGACALFVQKTPDTYLPKLSLHVGLQIDVIFSTATNPRWTAALQSVLPWRCIL